jgi:protein TonB
MNSSHTTGEAIRGHAQLRPQGSLWAEQSATTDSKLSLPIAVGMATSMTLLLIGVLENMHLHQADEAAPKIMRVVLTPPVLVPIPPAIDKPATKPLAKPMVKDVPPEHVAQVAVAKVVSPEVKAPQPVLAPAVIPAAAQPVAAAPAVATPNATGTPTFPNAASNVVAKPANTSTAIGAVCPGQVKPEMPRRAIEEGLIGTVRARALIQDGVVKEVTILSGPRVFHAAVKAAMLQYKCESHSEAVSAEQSIEFRAVE